jgi:CHAT domain-containing protein
MMLGALGADQTFAPDLAHQLWRDLFGGVEGALEGKRHLIIVPPPDLLALPFAALVTEAPTGGSLQDVPWLIRRYAVSVLPSLESFRTLRETAGEARLSPFLGIGDPQIGTAGAIDCDMQLARHVRSAPSTDAVLSDDGSALALANGDALRALTRLPDTACEVRAVAETLGNGMTLLGPAANESAIKALSAAGELSSYQTILFATHGLMAGEAGAQAPGLVLTPPEAPTIKDDGLLTSAEIATLRLSADLVILSACNTAAGDVGDGDALSGLSRAFFFAGARSLLVTHWSVYSEAATRISTSMMGALAEDPSLRKAEALRAAVLELIDEHGQSPMRQHPSYWGAFSIIGAD